MRNLSALIELRPEANLAVATLLLGVILADGTTLKSESAVHGYGAEE